MRKHLIAVLIVIVVCLAALCGCSAVKVFEKDLQVLLEVDGEYYGSYTVNIFNNAVVPEPEAPDGLQFRGWTADSEWENDAANVPVIENTGLIRYDDVKDYVVGNNQSVTLYAVFAEIPRHDLAIAWYSKSGTSGITETDMANFETSLYAYLTTQGYNPAEMDIVIRGYDSDVGSSCAAVMKDGDIDIMVGWNHTIATTGGMVKGEDFIENVSGINIGSIERYTARISDTELSNLVYAWIQNEYGNGVPEPVDPNAEYDLVIAWYNRHTSSTDSGLTEEIMSEFTEKLYAYLATQGYNTSDIKLAVRAYSGNVGDSCTEINTHGDVDIMVGWMSNIDSYVKFLQNVSGINIGTATRYVARLTSTDLSKLVFVWIQTEYGSGEVVQPIDPDNPDIPDNPDTPEEFVPVPASDTRLVIAWYDRHTGTTDSGLTEEVMEAFEIKLKEYLVAQNYDPATLDLHLRKYEGQVGESCAAIMANGDVDIMVGWNHTIATTGKMTEGENFLENVGGIKIDGSTERYAARITDTELVKSVYAWIQSEYGASTDPVDPDTPVEPPVDPDNPDGPDEPVEPSVQNEIVIGWWSYTTSGLTSDIMSKVESGLRDYLTEQGYDLNSVGIVIRNYDAKGVADVGKAVLDDGDVDIMLGMGKTFTSTGGVSALDKVDDIPMGSATNIRYIHLLTDGELSNLVYSWLQTDEGKALLLATE